MKQDAYPVWAVRGLLATALIVTTYFATADSDHMIVTINLYDKIQHMLAFFTLILLADYSWPRSPLNLYKVIMLLAYGFALELVQSQLPYRDYSLLDFLADGCGILLYFITIPVLRRLPLLRRRWQLLA